MPGCHREANLSDTQGHCDNNCSTDGTKEYLKAYAVRPQFQVIRTEQNIGGAGGFSLGVKTSVLGGGDYTWMMDDDTIPSPKALEALMQTATVQ